MSEQTTGRAFIGTPIVVDANTASTKRPLPTAPRLCLSVPANGCWFKFGNIDVVAAAGTAGVVAAQTLTSTGVFSPGETVTIGTTVYTFRNTLSTGPTIPYEVLIGGSQTNAHLNLLRAVNLTGTIGTDYSTGTLIHPTITALSSDGTHTVFNAKLAGTGPNATVSTETCANASFGAGTFASGAAAVETSFYLPPNVLFEIDNPLYTQTAQGYIAAIKNGTAALLYVQGMG